MAFDRFNDKPPRRSFSDRSPDRFSDRFGERSGDRSGDRFSSRGERSFGRPYNNRYEDGDGSRGERGFSRERFQDRPARFERGGERRDFGDRPRFGGKPGFKRFGGGSRLEGATRSGPRARAVETRRYADRTAFVQTASVRLDADVARFFKTPEDVNSALRQVIALSRLVRERQAEEAPEALPEEASAGTPGENEAGQASGAETAEDDAGAIEAQAGDEPGKPLAEHGA